MASENPSFLCWLKGEIIKNSRSSVAEISEPDNKNEADEDESSLTKSCSMLGKLTDLISTQQRALDMLSNYGQILDQRQSEMLQTISTKELSEEQVLKMKKELNDTQNRLEIIVHRLNVLSDTMEKTFELMECINKWQTNIGSQGDETNGNEPLNSKNEIKYDNLMPDKTCNDYDKNEIHIIQRDYEHETQEFITDINNSFDNLKIQSENIIYNGEDEISKNTTDQETMTDFVNEDIEVINQCSSSVNNSPTDKFVESMPNNKENDYFVIKSEDKNESNNKLCEDNLKEEVNETLRLHEDINKKSNFEMHSKNSPETQCALESLDENNCKSAESSNEDNQCVNETDIKMENKDIEKREDKYLINNVTDKDIIIFSDSFKNDQVRELGDSINIKTEYNSSVDYDRDVTILN